MGLRFNPPPNWPLPAGFVPPAGWQPDPAWPQAPAGWQLWLNDDTEPGFGAPGAPGYGAPGYGAPGYGASGYGTPGYGAPGYGAPGYGTPDASAPPGGYPQQAYQQFVVPQNTGVNGFAIAGFILSLIGVVLLGLIFSIVGLVQVRRRSQRGKGLAIAGLVLSGLWLVIVAVVIAGVVTSQVHRSAGGKITGSGHTDILSLRVGDCFQNPTVGSATVRVGQVTAVPCTTPHNAQVFAQFTATDASYPGAQALSTEAEQGCRTRIATSLDKSKITSTMALHFVYPQPQAWANGQRTLKCLVVDSTKDLTSSLLSGG